MHAAKHMGKLQQLLESQGSQVVTPELPGLGTDQTDPMQATLESHVATVLAAVDSVASEVVLVGHSLAGIIISAVAEQRPSKIELLVFLAAETRPGANWMETATNPGPEWLGEGLLQPLEGGMMGITEGKAERMAEIFFSGASREDICVYAALLRPQPPGYNEECLELTEGNFGQVRKAYIKTLQDQVNLPVHQDTWIARLGDGVVVKEIDSGHGPFISAPSELAEVLQGLCSLP